MAIKKGNLDYKWVILVVCFLMEFICLGFCSSNDGLYLTAVTKALDIPRTLYSITSSIRYIVQVVVALFFGTLLNRFGIKKMVGIGLTSLFASVVIRAYATEFYHLYIGGALWGLGIVFSGGTMASTVVRRWFHKDIGKITGIVMSANGIGGAIAAQIISPIINNGTLYGYRNAYKLSALFTLVITIIVLILLKDRPQDTQVNASSAKEQSRSVIWAGLEYAQIRKKPYFYLSAVMVFLTGISLQSIGSISIAHMHDVGLSAEFVATTATVSSLILTVSKILVGFTYDKKGLRFTLIMCHIATAVSFLLSALLTDSAAGMVMAMISVCLTSLAMPLETVMIPLLSNDLFGSIAYSKVLGIFMAMNSLGLCLGSPIGNVCYDLIGTYVPVIWLFFGIIIAVAIGFQFVIKVAQKDKEEILAKQEI